MSAVKLIKHEKIFWLSNISICSTERHCWILNQLFRIFEPKEKFKTGWYAKNEAVVRIAGKKT